MEQQFYQQLSPAEKKLWNQLCNFMLLSRLKKSTYKGQTKSAPLRFCLHSHINIPLVSNLLANGAENILTGNAVLLHGSSWIWHELLNDTFWLLILFVRIRVSCQWKVGLFPWEIHRPKLEFEIKTLQCTLDKK